MAAPAASTSATAASGIKWGEADASKLGKGLGEFHKKWLVETKDDARGANVQQMMNELVDMTIDAGLTKQQSQLIHVVMVQKMNSAIYGGDQNELNRLFNFEAGQQGVSVPKDFLKEVVSSYAPFLAQGGSFKTARSFNAQYQKFLGGRNFSDLIEDRLKNAPPASKGASPSFTFKAPTNADASAVIALQNEFFMTKDLSGPAIDEQIRLQLFNLRLLEANFPKESGALSWPERLDQLANIMESGKWSTQSPAPTILTDMPPSSTLLEMDHSAIGNRSEWAGKLRALAKEYEKNGVPDLVTEYRGIKNLSVPGLRPNVVSSTPQYAADIKAKADALTVAVKYRASHEEMSREFSALGATLLPTTDKADNAAKEAAAIDHIAQFASENNKAGDQLENAELKPDAEHFLDLLLKDRLKAGGSTDEFLQKLKARLGEPGASMGRATDNLLVAIENQQKALARVRIPSAPPSVTRTRIPSVEVPAPKTVAAMKYIPNFCSLPGDSAPPRRLVQSVIYQPPALKLATASDSGPRRPTLRSVIAPAPADTVAKDVEAEVKTEVMTSVDSSVRDNVQQSVEDSMEDAMSDAFED